MFTIKRVVVVVVVLVLIYTFYRTISSANKPSEEERETAGGDNVLEFVKNDDNVFVASTCVDGYEVDNGICKKSTPINELAITRAVYQGNCDSGGNLTTEVNAKSDEGTDITSRVKEVVETNPKFKWSDLNLDFCSTDKEWIVLEWTYEGVSYGPRVFKKDDIVDIGSQLVPIKLTIG